MIGLGTFGAIAGGLFGVAKVIASADRRRSRPGHADLASGPAGTGEPASGTAGTGGAGTGSPGKGAPAADTAGALGGLLSARPVHRELIHHRVRTSDGAELHVVETAGSASRPIVLLHGVTLTSDIWHNQMGDLGGRFRVLALDWRGHGRSTVGGDGYGLEVLARDLRAVLEHFDLRDAVLVGHSMGGMALMRFCADRQSLYRHAGRLVFLSTAARDVGEVGLGRANRLLSGIVRRRPSVAEHLPMSAPGDLGYAITRLGFGSKPSADWVEEAREMVGAMSPSAAGRSFLPLLAHDERATLRALDLPVLVMVGTRDLLTPEQQGREIADLVPGAKLVVFEGAGHLLMLERRERLASELARFAGGT